MSVFSVNQVRHLYVVNSVSDPSESSTAGTGNLKDAVDEIYLAYKGAGGLTRSDLINKKNILWAKAVDGSTLNEKAYIEEIKLNSEVNAGDPISGQDYILRILFENAFGMSDEDHYYKYGAVHATSSMTAADFYRALAKSLFMNMSRELNQFVTIALADASVVRPITSMSDFDSGSTLGQLTPTRVLIIENAMEWKRGTMAQDRIHFNCSCSTVTHDGDELIWGVVKNNTADPSIIPNVYTVPTVVTQGHKLADLEYFCMGFRGDQYRLIGWPNYVPTEYLVDPTASYYIFEIHYAFVDDNQAVQKSEKDITIISTDKTSLNTLVSTFNTLTGLSVAPIN